MSVQELEKAVSNLTPEEFREFREWFTHFDNDKWDAEMEADSTKPILQTLIKDALNKHTDGHSKEI